MLKTALASALIVGAASLPALAKSQAVQYTFGTANGAEYCDGLLLTLKGKTFTGTHNSPSGSCTEGDEAGGFLTKGFAAGAMGTYEAVTKKTQLATITTEEASGGTNFEIVFNLDLNSETWAAYVVEDGSTPVSGGLLFVGADAKANKLAHKPAHTRLNRPAVQK